jgi:hypothetical protein
VDTFMDTLRKQAARDLIEEAIAAAKREARAKGLVDFDNDAELRAWRSEQRPRGQPAPTRA